MADLRALCARCGEEKDLPLGRCAACGNLPTGEDRLVALVCSARVLDEASLRAAQARIRRGEPVRPSAALLARAEGVLRGERVEPSALRRSQIAGIVLMNLVFTPLFGYTVWFRYRSDPGPAARQALWATIPVSTALFGAWLAWRLNLANGW